jgi:hypothetical protein
MVKLYIASWYIVVFNQIYVVLVTVLSTLKEYDKDIRLHAD